MRTENIWRQRFFNFFLPLIIIIAIFVGHFSIANVLSRANNAEGKTEKSSLKLSSSSQSSTKNSDSTKATNGFASLAIENQLLQAHLLPGTFFGEFSSVGPVDGQYFFAQSSLLTSTVDKKMVAPQAKIIAKPNTKILTPHLLSGKKSLSFSNRPLSFKWFLLTRPKNSIAQINSNEESATDFGNETNITIIPDLEGTYTIGLIVSNGVMTSAMSSFSFRAYGVGENIEPVADAGPDRNIKIKHLEFLDGSKSFDQDGTSLFYSWFIAEKPLQSKTSLENSECATPSFTADLLGDYLFGLIVDDGKKKSVPSFVTVSASNRNTPPVANAGGPQIVRLGDTVNLDGSKSNDLDGDKLKYEWLIQYYPPNGQTTLEGLGTTASFVARAVGEYHIKLIVNDGFLRSNVSSSSSVVTIEVTENNASPIANAGEDKIISLDRTDEKILLDGSNSVDADNDLLQYSWKIVEMPSSSLATLKDSNTVEPELIADLVGIYKISLVVNDEKVKSDEDTVTITILPSNDIFTTEEKSLPIAVVGKNQIAYITSTVFLDGSKSGDATGSSLNFFWTMKEQPPNSRIIIQNAKESKAFFIPDEPGIYRASLVVSNLVGTAKESILTIKVKKLEISFETKALDSNFLKKIKIFGKTFLGYKIYLDDGEKRKFLKVARDEDFVTIENLKYGKHYALYYEDFFNDSKIETNPTLRPLIGPLPLTIINRETDENF